MTLRLKSCPRYGGDIRLDRDRFGWYEQCIQCSYEHDLEAMTLGKEMPEPDQLWHEDDTWLKQIEPLGQNDFKREDNV